MKKLSSKRLSFAFRVVNQLNLFFQARNLELTQFANRHFDLLVNLANHFTQFEEDLTYQFKLNPSN